MTARPCASCGEVIAAGTYCGDCRPRDTRVRRGPGQAAYDPVWRALSKRARRLQPWCEDCGTAQHLTTDHIIPKSLVPELVHAVENLAVRCRSCNARRAATGWTAAEAREVLARLDATYRRRPARLARQRAEALRSMLCTRGVGVNDATPTPPGRPSLRYTPQDGRS